MGTLTYRDLIIAAQSADPAERRRALDAFNAWVKVGPKLPVHQRLTQMERDVLNRIFANRQGAPSQVRRA